MKPLKNLLSTAVIFTILIHWGLLTPTSIYAQDKPVVQKLSDNVYSAFILFYNSLVVIGDEGVLITDPANPFRAGMLKKKIAKLTDKPVTKIVLAHEHFDHIGGTEIFEGAEIIAQEKINAVLDFDPLGMGPKQIDVTFSEMLTLDLGTTQVELSYLGAGDGVATTIVSLPKEKVVLTADMYDSYGLTPGTFLDDKNMLGSRSILNTIAQWDLNHAITTHSQGTEPETLRLHAQYYNDLFDAVFPAVQEMAKTNPAGMWQLPDSLSKSVKLPKYEEWGGYDQLPHHVRRMVLAIIHGG